MSRTTQGLLMAFLGAVLLRLALSDAYLRYVTAWMKWPIAASGLLLLGLAAGLVLARPDHHDHDHDHADHGVPRVTWLLLLPGLVTFAVSPPQLGSYLAERRSGESVVVAEPDDLSAFDSSQVIDVPVTEFIWRAQEGGQTLEGQPVELTGFVTYAGTGDQWFVTRLVIGCCAADAIAYRVSVDPADGTRPARDQWVQVTGLYSPGTGTTGREDPVLRATDVVEIATPKQTYE